MRLHGDDMSDLMWSVLFLDHESTHAIAEDIARTPRIARPLEGEQDMNDLNHVLSPAFFEIQDELVEHSKALAAAASEKDRVKVADEFGDLMKTCVRCHSTYLNEPMDVPAPDTEVEEDHSEPSPG